MQADPFRYFRVEARELLEQLGRGVLDMEKDVPPAQLVQDLLRHAHTLKGAARVVKQSAIAAGAHAVEDALAPFRAGGVAASRNDVDVILKHLDRMTAAVAQLDAPAVKSPSASVREQDVVPEVSAAVEELDTLIDGLGEALVQLGALRRSLEESDDGAHVADEVTTTHARARRAVGTRTSDPAAWSGTSTISAQSRATTRNRTRDARSRFDLIERELCQARDAAVSLRLVPAKTMFGPLERIARDAARALGKSVVLEAHGGDLRLEAPVLKSVQDALIQVVRNAVAHGIEHESERRAAGKPPAGTVKLDVTSRGDHVVFVCRDDGRGLDLAGLRSAAEDKGLVDPAATEVLAETLIQILLRGGVSTSKAVTEVAGRGIGLDVVREAVERVGGAVTVKTEASVGTTVEIVVPLTLAAVDALTVHAGDRLVALPLAAVRRTIRVAANQLVRGSTAASIVVDGEIVPFAPLSCCLEPDSDADTSARAWTTVIVSAGGALAAVGVERIVGTSRVIARSIPRGARVEPVVAGFFLDAEGNPQLVLDAANVVRDAARQRTSSAGKRAAVRPPILIVDDSLTTRMLEQSILESAGYEVVLAVSGEDGLEKAGRTRFGLILVDVEMPGMDGFAFVKRLRADPELHSIPAILVTSRDSEADRLRGREAGATAHISKGEFDQSELLDRIRSLVG